MGRKVQHVRYRLDARDITELPFDEIAAILRGADDLIMSGGRSMLVKILKGSRDKKLPGLHLDESPMYGYYHHLTMDEIAARVDWVAPAPTGRAVPSPTATTTSSPPSFQC